MGIGTSSSTGTIVSQLRHVTIVGICDRRPGDSVTEVLGFPTHSSVSLGVFQMAAIQSGLSGVACDDYVILPQ